uniref:Uncharacterized protein n=1 Tax=Lactuca sativa TaxID=4236 RepID=A0A9R1W7V0_LACSA|nr:hypothetical protein LSAT_V11C300125810 [Lactuca sativa]
MQSGPRIHRLQRWSQNKAVVFREAELQKEVEIMNAHKRRIGSFTENRRLLKQFCTRRRNKQRLKRRWRRRHFTPTNKSPTVSYMQNRRR